METTQALNINRHHYTHRSRASLGFFDRLRVLWRQHEAAQELLLKRQAPWLVR